MWETHVGSLQDAFDSIAAIFQTLNVSTVPCIEQLLLQINRLLVSIPHFNRWLRWNTWRRWWTPWYYWKRSDHFSGLLQNWNGWSRFLFLGINLGQRFGIIIDYTTGSRRRTRFRTGLSLDHFCDFLIDVILVDSWMRLLMNYHRICISGIIKDCNWRGSTCSMTSTILAIKKSKFYKF